MSSQPEDTSFCGWAIVELMGHQRTAGRISQGSVGGMPAMRLEVFIGDAVESAATHFFTNGDAVYRITPTTEQICRRVAAANVPAPVQPWQLPPMLESRAAHADETHEIDDENWA